MSEPEFPEVQMHLVRPRTPVTGTIVESTPCLNGRSASFVRHIAVDVSGTPLAGNFHAGQAFGVIPPGEEPSGKPHSVRLYSIASPSWGEDGQGQIISTTCKRLIDENSSGDADEHELFLGVCSNYLCDRAVGDQIQVTGPAGKRFVLPVDRDHHDYLFVATGTGIAPFRGMVKELLEHPDGPSRSEIHLVMGAPYGTDLMYHDWFKSLEETHSGFHYHTVVSRPESGDRQYVDRYITNAGGALHELLARDRALLYLCGIEGMQNGLYRLLEELGVADEYLVMPEEMEKIVNAEPDQLRKIRPRARCMVEVY
ncbi:MAG: hypothetical protein CMJ40_10740 [Phycisphaerae bacterium]|nr:hypothetical protein [Phycisphaerae bacterium]|tara:strand:- start:482 stop:1417 length:936 start_codon:yes stop_codon:yes gene_type:complete